MLLTGHTGFKGAWLATWLHDLGAVVTGYALPPEPGGIAERAGIERMIHSIRDDICNADALVAAFDRARPEIVLHLAAQSLVRRSYAAPLETLATNVLGTAHVLEAARTTPGVQAVVIVTSDKCYEPRPRSSPLLVGRPGVGFRALKRSGRVGREHRSAENARRMTASVECLPSLKAPSASLGAAEAMSASNGPFTEADRLGGHDPYSASKACAELVAAAWQRSFAGPPIATARAGNVIGGGDNAADRLVPDCLRAWTQGEAVPIRNPAATRPWQHVLDPLCGYLLLAERLAEDGSFAGPWNFGPAPQDAVPVLDVVQMLATAWGDGAAWDIDKDTHPAETQELAVDATQARARLGWQPRLALADAVGWTVAWHKAAGDAASLIRADICRYADGP